MGIQCQHLKCVVLAQSSNVRFLPNKIIMKKKNTVRRLTKLALSVALLTVGTYPSGMADGTPKMIRGWQSRHLKVVINIPD